MFFVKGGTVFRRLRRDCRTWFQAAAGFLDASATLKDDSGTSILSDQAVRPIKPRIRTRTAGNAVPVRLVVAERAGRRPQGKTQWKRDPSEQRLSSCGPHSRDTL